MWRGFKGGKKNEDIAYECRSRRRGGKTHIISLLDQFPTDEVELAVFEDGIVAREAREIGIKVHVFSQKSRYDLSILKNISRFINEEQFDIVHTHEL